MADWLKIGLTMVGVSSMLGSVNYMTTIINMRAPGMTLFRMPLTIWSMFITAILQAFALPVLTAAGFMLVAERVLGFTFFVPGYRFMPAYKNRLWDGKIRLMDLRNNTIYHGLFPYIQKFCSERKYAIDLNSSVNSTRNFSAIEEIGRAHV